MTRPKPRSKSRPSSAERSSTRSSSDRPQRRSEKPAPGFSRKDDRSAPRSDNPRPPRRVRPDEDTPTSSLPGIRINRFFTENGLISRREADRAIEDGRVQINGRSAKLGDRVMPKDTVTLDGRTLQTGEKDPVILAFHKPVGVECTTDMAVEGNIIDAVNYHERVFPIGRLDKMSEGLILLTNIGDIVNKVLRAKYFHEKEYVVTIKQSISDAHVAELRAGIDIGDGYTRPCKVTRVAPKVLNMVLTEGRNRQIRRMLEALGHEVMTLQRTRIMDIRLGGLKYGHWRKFSDAETAALLKQLKD